MIRLELTAEEIETLEMERFTHGDPKVQRRLEAVFLKSQGLAHGQICALCRLSEPRFVRMLRLVQQEGIEGLKRFGYRGRPNLLQGQASTLQAHFRTHPPASSREAQAIIEEHTGLRRSPTQVRQFLHRLKMRYRKVGFVPGPSDQPDKQQEQEDFVKKNSRRNWPKPRRGSGWSFS